MLKIQCPRDLQNITFTYTLGTVLVFNLNYIILSLVPVYIYIYILRMSTEKEQKNLRHACHSPRNYPFLIKM